MKYPYGVVSGFQRLIISYRETHQSEISKTEHDDLIEELLAEREKTQTQLQTTVGS